MGSLLPESREARLWYLCRRYAQAPGEVGGLLVTYQLSNMDPYNALEIGSLSIPLVFQVVLFWSPHRPPFTCTARSSVPVCSLYMTRAYMLMRSCQLLSDVTAIAATIKFASPPVLRRPLTWVISEGLQLTTRVAGFRGGGMG